MRTQFALAWSYVLMLAKARMSYRADFFVEVASDVLLQAVNLAFLAVVFTRIEALGGWSFDEVLFIYGFSLIPFALFNASFASLSAVGGRYVVSGELDRVLTRPMNALLQVQLELLRPQALNGVALGLVVMAIASVGLQIAWTPLDVLAMIAATLGAWLVYGGVFVTVASLTFWTQDRGAGFFPIAYNTIQFGRYPLNIYPAMVQFLLTFVLPYAFIAFLPAAGVLRSEYARLGWLTLPVGIVVFVIGLFVWKRGLARYEGAGS